MDHMQIYCTWIERLISSATERTKRAAMLEATPKELQDLRRSHLRDGYDPYNTVDTYRAPNWIKPGGTARALHMRARGW